MIGSSRWQPHPTGHLPPFDDSGKQPSERLLHFRTCLKASAHNSAEADIQSANQAGQECAAHLPLIPLIAGVKKNGAIPECN
jgi:hypothetical protein